MAEQGTEEKSSTNGDENAGRHAASEESGSGEQQAPAEQKTESSSEQTSESSSEQTQQTQQTQQAPAERKTESSSDQKTQEHANGQARSEKSAEQNGSGGRRGQADTSWAEDEHEPSGSSRHRSLDVGELAWRTGNVLATIVRTLALLFALVLIVNVVLVLVGVNPTNGVAQFVGTVASVVILGFRDLFVPADPTIMLIVNSLIAAVFWAFVGELLSRVIRFLAARVK
jgi:hypothetical protein